MDSAAWDERYRQAAAGRGGRLWSSAPQRVIQDLLGPLAPGSALDLAAGDGRNAIFLARAGWSVTAVDFSAEAIRLARHHADEHGVDATWVVADARDYTPGRLFDLVLVTYLHLPAAENRSVLRRASRWIAPGGHFLVLGHDKANLASGAPGPRDADILYTRELLEGCAEGLVIRRNDQLFRDSHVDPEGPNDTAATAVDTLLFATAPQSSRARRPYRDS
jgi:Methylase involved in ubiquinone/menaquinone biosynthesis